MIPGLRFGVITSGTPDGKAWRDLARRAEALGYSTLFMPDHFQEGWPSARTPWRARLWRQPLGSHPAAALKTKTP
jgi:alkanesulfonate monooxygenase SsuD/methylene tetrahydromethanopterin reductase-like flavin-dependent oxidoreductase (luciferase family)